MTEGHNPVIVSRNAEWFALLAEIRELCARELGIGSPLVSFDPAQSRQILAILFGIRSFDTFDAIVYLAKAGHVVQGEALQRTLVELIFYFGCVEKSQEAADRFVAAFQIERRDTAKKMARWKDASLVAARDQLPMEEIRARIDEEIRKSGASKKEVVDWAAEAGLEDIYLSEYPFLSGSVHSSLSSLERHHLVTSKDGIPVAFRSGPSEQGLIPLLAAAGNAILMAASLHGSVFSRPRPSQFDDFDARIGRMAGLDNH
jgi:hypothetical protein